MAMAESFGMGFVTLFALVFAFGVSVGLNLAHWFS